MRATRRQRRGLSLLEALLALVVLGAATTIGVGGMGAIQQMNRAQQDRLNGMEVAHRLLLNHMIDPDSLPDTERPIAQGDGVYRYELDENVLEAEDRGSRTRRRSRPMREMTGNQRLQAGLVMATVRVYLDNGYGGPDLARGPVAELSRIYDPFDTDEETIMFNQLEALMGINAPPPRVPQQR